MRIRLQFSVALVFSGLTVIVLGATVGWFYWGNRTLAMRTALGEMAEALAQSDRALAQQVAPVVRVVARVAQFATDFPEDIGSRRGHDLIRAEFAEVDSVYSVFVADRSTGRFSQVARVLPGMQAFGVDQVPVPAGAAQVHRLISDVQGTPMDSLQFVDAAGRVLGRSLLPSEFDATSRPWYAAALTDARVVVSEIYTFSSSGRPGVTFSNRFLDAAGQVRGVVGVDMSLDSLATLLGSVRVDGVGEVFMVDAGSGALVATSETAGAADAHPLTEAAMALWDGTDGTVFRVDVPGVRRGYLVSMKRLTPVLNAQPIMGVIVPTDHVVGGIATTTRQALAVSALVGLLALAATVLLARLLGASLRQVSDEAGRISAFDLSGAFTLQSRIAEVAELGAAMRAMKNSLASFGAYVPKEVVRSLVASGGNVAVGGTAREVTLMFSDIEGFTRKTESLPPEVTMRDLSRYFSAMSAAVASTGGSVDKYIGDAVMAIWNAPGAVADHVAAACRGALACHAAEAALNAQGDGALFPVRTRIGLHCDRVVVGNVGSADRLQYTAIGGAVNLASRVEGLNKVYGTAILATGAVVERAGAGFVFREVDLVSPAGTTRPVALYELVGAAGQVDAAVLRDVEAWAAALGRYRARDWAAAAAGFAALQGGPAGARLVALYLDRCARLAAAPPGEGWTGVTVLSEK
jgi:adenylate cyclase